MNPFQTAHNLIRADQIKLLAKYFFRKVDSNSDLRKLYPEDLSSAEGRLYLFLLQVFSDPQTYSEQRGHPRLKMRHMQWEIDSSIRYYWLNAKFIAMDKIDLDPNVKELMIEYFVKLANHMINND